MAMRQLNPGITLVLGGARSGKSRFGEKLVLSSGLDPVYLATGRAHDEEMSERIAIHRERRGKSWNTIEEPLALSDALVQSCSPGSAILVDCLTLWVTNLMMAKANVTTEYRELVSTFGNLKAPVVLISNETGLGIVPENAMAREFRDLAGEVNQAVAEIADEVWFVAAGIPLALKPQN